MWYVLLHYVDWLRYVLIYVKLFLFGCKLCNIVLLCCIAFNCIVLYFIVLSGLILHYTTVLHFIVLYYPIPCFSLGVLSNLFWNLFIFVIVDYRVLVVLYFIVLYCALLYSSIFFYCCVLSVIVFVLYKVLLR